MFQSVTAISIKLFCFSVNYFVILALSTFPPSKFMLDYGYMVYTFGMQKKQKLLAFRLFQVIF